MPFTLWWAITSVLFSLPVWPSAKCPHGSPQAQWLVKAWFLAARFGAEKFFQNSSFISAVYYLPHAWLWRGAIVNSLSWVDSVWTGSKASTKTLKERNLQSCTQFETALRETCPGLENRALCLYESLIANSELLMLQSDTKLKAFWFILWILYFLCFAFF